MVINAITERVSESHCVSASGEKANFSQIYNLPDPRAYFSVLHRFGYVVPGEARPVLARVIEAVRERRHLSPVSVLDFGCSYGVNAALLKFGLTLDELYGHYDCPRLRDLSPQQVLEEDVAFFRPRADSDGIRMIGADIAERAVAYGCAAGLLDASVTENLEEDEPSAETAAKLEGVDLIATTGCVGYVSERSFRRILRCIRTRAAPWVASFVLRIFPYEEIAAALAAFGLETEKLEGRTFVQRRFVDRDERHYALRTLEDLGVDPAGKEADGRYHAEFFLSRPPADIRAAPLETLLRLAS